VTHFYGDALTNYHTTIILLDVSWLISSRLVSFWLGAGIVTHFYGDALILNLLG
jgi:hypothetical protein